MVYLWLCLILIEKYIQLEKNHQSTQLLSINNETNCFPLLCFSSRFILYAPSFILGQLFLDKTPLKLGSQLEYLIILILLKGWSVTKNFYLCCYVLFALSLHLLLSTYFLTLVHLRFPITYQEIHLSVVWLHVLLFH